MNIRSSHSPGSARARIVFARTLVLAIALLAIGLAGSAQALDSLRSDEQLQQAVLALDEAVFDAFNNCKVEQFVEFFSEDLEFYHDQTGMTRGLETLAQSLRDNICGKVKRVLVKESVRVYRMKGFGALETGTHRFQHPGRDDVEPVGEARFIHLWRYKDGRWRIVRVISFDHRSLPR